MSKISGLTEKSSLDDTDMIVIEEAGGSNFYANVEAISDMISDRQVLKTGQTCTEATGKLVILNSSGEWTLADRSTNAVGFMGLNLGDGVILLMGTLSSGGLTRGATYYLGSSGNFSITPPASGSGDFLRIVGYGAEVSTELWFNPDKTYIKMKA